MSDQAFECEDSRPKFEPWKEVLFTILYALAGVAILFALYQHVGLESLIVLIKFVFATAGGVTFLVMAWFKWNYYWTRRKFTPLESGRLVLTGKELEHQAGLTKFVIPYETIKEILEPKGKETTIKLILSDDNVLTLPTTIKQREFLAHIKSEVGHVS